MRIHSRRQASARPLHCLTIKEVQLKTKKIKQAAVSFVLCLVMIFPVNAETIAVTETEDIAVSEETAELPEEASEIEVVEITETEKEENISENALSGSAEEEEGENLGADPEKISGEWERIGNDSQMKPAGDGTEESPYVIDSVSGLIWLSYNTALGLAGSGNEFYVLDADLDYAGYTKTFGSWRPIGGKDPSGESSALRPFSGHFDGNGHTVRGISILPENGETVPLAGFFGVVAGGTVRNLVIEADTVTAREEAGILAARITGNAEIHNVTVSGHINAGVQESAKAAAAGGICGSAEGSGLTADGAVILENCTAENISLNVSGEESAAGGICGKASGAFLIDSSVTSDMNYGIRCRGAAGGICGIQENTCIYSSYIDGLVGGNGSKAVGGVTGEYVSGEIYVVQMDGEIASTNRALSHEGIIIGTRSSATSFVYGTDKGDEAGYLFYHESLRGKAVCGSGLPGDANGAPKAAETGFWTENELKYVITEGQRNFPCEDDRFFYEELEDGVRFLITGKMNRKFTADEYAKGLRFSIDHYAPGVSGSPVKGHLLSIPVISAGNSSDTDVAYFTAIAGNGSVFNKLMDKDSCRAVAPGTLVRVSSSSKNRPEENKYFQRTVDETVLPEKVRRPTYTSSGSGRTELFEMDYQDDGTYTFLMPDSDSEINIYYDLMASEIVTLPEREEFRITETRSGSRKSPDVTWTITDSRGNTLCNCVQRTNPGRGTSGEWQYLGQEDVTPVTIEAVFNHPSSDNRVLWSVDDSMMLDLSGTEPGYTETTARIRPQVTALNRWLFDLVSAAEIRQMNAGYATRIPDTVYERTAVLSASTEKNKSLDQTPVFAHCTIGISFRIIDNTVLYAEGVSLDRDELSFTVKRTVTGSRTNPKDSFEITGVRSVTATVEPEGADITSVTWELLGDAAADVKTQTEGEGYRNFLASLFFDGSSPETLPGWMKELYEEDSAKKKADPSAQMELSGRKTGRIRVTAVDRELGVHTDTCAVTVEYVTEDKTTAYSSAGGGGTSSASSGTSGSGTSAGMNIIKNANGLPSYVVSGQWRYVNGLWSFADHRNMLYTGRWAAVFNPYAVAPQPSFDWFRFDPAGNMVTGWFTDPDDGHTYYLWTVSDNTLGHMVTGYQYLDGNWYYFNEVSDGTRGALFCNGETPRGDRTDSSGRVLVNGNPCTDPGFFPSGS